MPLVNDQMDSTSTRESPTNLLQKIDNHPFHPYHSLILQDHHVSCSSTEEFYCSTCTQTKNFTSIYQCEQYSKCKFRICSECFTMVPNIEYPGLEHTLCFMEKIDEDVECDADDSYCKRDYRCDELDHTTYSFIFRCVAISTSSICYVVRCRAPLNITSVLKGEELKDRDLIILSANEQAVEQDMEGKKKTLKDVIKSLSEEDRKVKVVKVKNYTVAWYLRANLRNLLKKHGDVSDDDVGSELTMEMKNLAFHFLCRVINGMSRTMKKTSLKSFLEIGMATSNLRVVWDLELCLCMNN
ncbi:hypothetical protein PanWU01x14_293610 [Parasponia andersonii]|uniref:Uncharacterized protein n=1 Tax=Parasponia andersonii TaxID=3476 RepID=A0A2P5AWK5_PARAD|nr:hypothetical protein PanWU01x14_293610 [Parasponia andersonii]